MWPETHKTHDPTCQVTVCCSLVLLSLVCTVAWYTWIILTLTLKWILSLSPLFPRCLPQAGLHLSETERQLHGDPQQRRWDWKVGLLCGYTTGDRVGVIQLMELWSYISHPQREGSQIVLRVPTEVRNNRGRAGRGLFLEAARSDQNAPTDLEEWKAARFRQRVV